MDDTGEEQDDQNPADYADYLLRRERAGVESGRSHRRLDPEAFARLAHEYDRLVRRIDPADIQLDEWKRLEELRFLLLIDEEDETE